MEDIILNCRVEPVAKRALDIYSATENINKKDIVSEALSSRIPGQYFVLAKKAVEKESAENDGN